MTQAREQLLRPSSSAKIGLLDGGQATHLESFGHDLSSALWSASLLASSSTADHASILRLHSDFLAVGAQIIGTLTYQLSDLATQTTGWDAERTKTVTSLFHRAIQLAGKAREESPSRGSALVALTLGPYGAALANGSEYTGDYSKSPQSAQPSFEDMVDFHQTRLEQALQSPDFHSTIDLIAFETLPRLDEAEAISVALQRLAGKTVSRPGQTLPPAYISFVFPPRCKGHLPWPSEAPIDRTTPAAVAKRMSELRDGCEWPIIGVGINCTKPELLQAAVEGMTTGAAAASKSHGSMQLFLYPDGGLVWDAQARRWLPPTPYPTSSSSSSSSSASPDQWSTNLIDLAHRTTMASTSSSTTTTMATTRTGRGGEAEAEAEAEGDCEVVWSKVWIGGCCKTGPAEISGLKKGLQQSLLEPAAVAAASAAAAASTQ